MNKTAAEAHGRLPGRGALILWCCTAVTRPCSVLNCRSSPGNTSVRVQVARRGRRRGEARRQGELLSIKLLFHWLLNWPWNHCAQSGGFFPPDAGEDLLVSSKSRQRTDARHKHAQTNRTYWFLFLQTQNKKWEVKTHLGLCFCLFLSGSQTRTGIIRFCIWTKLGSTSSHILQTLRFRDSKHLFLISPSIKLLQPLGVVSVLWRKHQFSSFEEFLFSVLALVALHLHF